MFFYSNLILNPYSGLMCSDAASRISPRASSSRYTFSSDSMYNVILVIMFNLLKMFFNTFHLQPPILHIQLN